MDEQALLVRLRRNDPDAWKEFWERYSNFLFRFICSISRAPQVKNPLTQEMVEADQDAQDILADTFVNALTGIKKFKGHTQAELQAWLHSIARHRAADFYRGQGRQRFVDRIISGLPAVDGVGDEGHSRGTPRIKAETQSMAVNEATQWHSRANETLSSDIVEEIHELRGALSQLTERQRQVILIRLAGSSFKETGEALCISEAAAKMAFSRGIRELQKLLGAKIDGKSEGVAFDG